ncbi:MAG: prolyl oligopeptidase family serine peptidase [Gemmataceae bacterium]|nr:prolyl oligopeptidase family serine peptidase [Gemmataceae bacterium]MDW8264599.1 prolyl oligopeptidase family serine peptidase [Gemmataceae bacterium]
MRAGMILGMLGWALVSVGAAAEPAAARRGDAWLAAYFRAETRRLADACLSDIRTLADWTSRREEYRRQLREMLGLDPFPERTPLQAQVTGTVDHPEFTVEKIHFQSRPGLYVTGNLYIPKGLKKPAPTILYVCGHSRVVHDGVPLGAKTHYQHHAGWFARHGYVCFVIDTLQLGEIEGIHHGTYRYGMWWWNSRGYTPAGVEAWNGIRALDYLETRPEVDKERFGITGRSGGGAYSWWVAALDDRIQAAVPVAGITDLENHVVDGTVEGHCDCMFMVNTYRWDYAQVAALVAPRPLLITNTDKDRIFPLEGVQRLHQKVRHIYRLYKADDRLGLQISEGPHWDVVELQVAAFRWFNRFLKKEDPPIEQAARKFFEPPQLRVFSALPADQLNTRIHETFVPAAQPRLPADAADWARLRDGWLSQLRERSFRGWPTQADDLDVQQAFTAEHQGLRLTAYDFTSQQPFRLRLYVLRRADDAKDELVVLNVLDDREWKKFLAWARVGFADRLQDEPLPEADPKEYEGTTRMLRKFRWAMAYVAPRGVGPTAFDPNEKKQTQIRRRFMLLGQTLEGMQTWDVRRAVQALRTIDQLRDVPLWLQGHRHMAGVALYASLFEPDIKRLDLWELPRSHHQGPDYLNVLRFLDVPQAVALAAERSAVRLYQANAEGWSYATDVAAKLGWEPKRIQVRIVPGDGGGGADAPANTGR